MKHTSKHKRPTTANDSTKGVPGSPVLQSIKHTEAAKKQNAWHCARLTPLPVYMLTCGDLKTSLRVRGSPCDPLGSRLDIVPSVLVCCESQKVAKNVTAMQKHTCIWRPATLKSLNLQQKNSKDTCVMSSQIPSSSKRIRAAAHVNVWGELSSWIG